VVSIKPLQVIPRKTVPATSTLLTITSVCANAKAKNLTTAWKLIRVGMFWTTCEIETVDRSTMKATTKKAKGITNRLTRKINCTFFIILFAIIVIVFVARVIPLILIRHIFTYLSHFRTCSVHPCFNCTLCYTLGFCNLFVIFVLNNIQSQNSSKGFRKTSKD